MFVLADMICKLFVLYKPQAMPKKVPSGVIAEIDPREVFMRSALK